MSPKPNFEVPVDSKILPWREWARVVLLEIQRLSSVTDKLTDTIDDLRKEFTTTLADHASQDVKGGIIDKAGIDAALSAVRAQQATLATALAELRIKAGYWGMIGALIPIVTSILVWLVTKLV